MSEIVTEKMVGGCLSSMKTREREKTVSREREKETEIIPVSWRSKIISYSFSFITPPPHSYNKGALFAYVWSRWVSFMRVCVGGGGGRGENLCPRLATLWRIKENVYLNSWSWKFFWRLQSRPKKKPSGTLITCFIFLTFTGVFAPLLKHITFTRFLVRHSGTVRMPAPSQRPSMHGFLYSSRPCPHQPEYISQPNKLINVN